MSSNENIRYVCVSIVICFACSGFAAEVPADEDCHALHESPRAAERQIVAIETENPCGATLGVRLRSPAQIYLVGNQAESVVAWARRAVNLWNAALGHRVIELIVRRPLPTFEEVTSGSVFPALVVTDDNDKFFAVCQSTAGCASPGGNVFIRYFTAEAGGSTQGAIWKWGAGRQDSVSDARLPGSKSFGISFEVERGYVVIAHELGHFLGLGHTAVSGNIMTPNRGPPDRVPRIMPMFELGVLPLLLDLAFVQRGRDVPWAKINRALAMQIDLGEQDRAVLGCMYSESFLQSWGYLPWWWDTRKSELDW